MSRGWSERGEEEKNDQTPQEIAYQMVMENHQTAQEIAQAFNTSCSTNYRTIEKRRERVV